METSELQEQINDLDEPIEVYLLENGYEFMQKLEETEEDALKTSELEELTEGQLSAAKVMGAYEKLYDVDLREINGLDTGYVWDIGKLTSQTGFDELKNYLGETE